jgi:UPF0271 protein
VSARTIDLNADLGEDPRALASGQEAALLDVVTSANVACGGHAGDEQSMRAVVRLARERGVAVGAHPSYPDRRGFGRAPQDLPPDEIEATVHEQVARLGEIARAERVPLVHVKPHGALYHAASGRAAVAEAIARAAARWSRDLVLVGPAGSEALTVWRAQGLRAAGEGFADRAYEPDGSLRPRSKPGALLTDPAAAAAQAVRLARSGTAETLCVHGDTPGAVALARAVRTALLAAGLLVRALGHPGGDPRC